MYLVLDPLPSLWYNGGMKDTKYMDRCDYCGLLMPLAHFSDSIIAPWMLLCGPCADHISARKALQNS